MQVGSIAGITIGCPPAAMMEEPGVVHGMHEASGVRRGAFVVGRENCWVICPMHGMQEDADAIPLREGSAVANATMDSAIEHPAQRPCASGKVDALWLAASA